MYFVGILGWSGTYSTMDSKKHVHTLFVRMLSNVSEINKNKLEKGKQ